MGKIYTFNDKIITINNKWCEEYVEPTPVDPYNPLGLPPNTVRVRTNDRKKPTKLSYMGATYDNATLVSGTTDVYDVYKSGTDFNRMLYRSDNIIEILGANTTGVTNMTQMFSSCTEISNIPLFDTSSVTNMNYMFVDCYQVQSGALALYQQASTQATPPSSHTLTFSNCGSYTTTGAAELAQIPSSWGGTGA